MDIKSFIGGFVSGEGCFTFNKTQARIRDGMEFDENGYGRKLYKRTLSVAPIFSITLSIRDKSTLELIKQEIGYGNVNVISKEAVSFTVTNLSDCESLVDYFEGYLFGEKKKDFEIWKKGLPILKKIYGKQRKHPKIVKQILKLRPRSRRK